MLDWIELAKLDNEELEKIDVIRKNAICAIGLPDGCDMDTVEACVAKADYLARRVGQYTEAKLRRFRPKRYDFYQSEPYFRILCMITALQRDLGIRYNPLKIPEHIPLDTADMFVHGALLGDGGTCASLPVVYVGVGRRLGYPLKLVGARTIKKWNHLFARWDEPGSVQFNIEATAPGLKVDPDDHFRAGIFEISPEIEKYGCLLKSRTPREELSGFLCGRGFRWADFGEYRQAVNSFGWSCALQPENVLKRNTLIDHMNQWGKSLDQRRPPDFPPMYIKWPPRRFSDGLREDLERDIIGLEATENVLKDPELERRWWEPMRRGVMLREKPTAIHVDCRSNGMDVRVLKSWLVAP